MGHYTLVCTHPDCRRRYAGSEDRFRLFCDDELDGMHGPALLRTLYEKKRITAYEDLGLSKYRDWLPWGNLSLNIPGITLTYKSRRTGASRYDRARSLGDFLGLNDLWIAYSAYRGDGSQNDIRSRTFKLLEASGVYGRVAYNFRQLESVNPFLITSAGNTANAFAFASHCLNVPVAIVIPESGLESMVLPVDAHPFLIVVKGGDYSDAIAIGEKVAERRGLMVEGGVRNIGRRDGMGTAMLEAVLTRMETDGKGIFDHYVQAVGSGTGGIAAWETVCRLRNDGRFGDNTTTLHLAQSSSFAPMVDAFENPEKTLSPINEEMARLAIFNVAAPVLTNRNPAWSIKGGVRDALEDTGGKMYRVSNKAAAEWGDIFWQLEGRHVGDAPKVAIAALAQAVNEDYIKSDESVLLHVTGGGLPLQMQRECLFPMKPDLLVPREGDFDELMQSVSLATYSPLQLVSK